MILRKINTTKEHTVICDKVRLALNVASPLVLQVHLLEDLPSGRMGNFRESPSCTSGEKGVADGREGAEEGQRDLGSPLAQSIWPAMCLTLTDAFLSPYRKHA